MRQVNGQRGNRPARPGWRVALATIGFAGAALALAVAFAPADWLSATQAAPGQLVGWLTANGIRPLPLGLALALAAGALVALLARFRPRRRRWPALFAPLGAPVAVYLDLENQAIASANVPAFMAYLRQQLRGRRADLFLFADLSIEDYARKAQALIQHGFRAIHVSHRLSFSDQPGVGDTSVAVKNVVDMELGLFVLERAISGSRRQEIILILNDRDYVPLIRRLWELGHRVQVWARWLQPGLKQIELGLPGVTINEFGDRFTAHQTTLAGHSNAPPVVAAAPKPVLLTFESGKLPSLEETIAKTIDLAQTLRLQRSSIKKKPFTEATRYQSFLNRIGNSALFRALGYSGNDGSFAWLRLLTTLGVFKQNDGTKMPAVGSTTVSVAADTLNTWLQAVAASCRAVQASDSQGSFGYAQVRDHLLTAEGADLAPLQTLLRSDPVQMRYLVAALNALGLLRSEPIDDQTARILPEPAPHPQLQNVSDFTE